MITDDIIDFVGDVSLKGFVIMTIRIRAKMTARERGAGDTGCIVKRVMGAKHLGVKAHDGRCGTGRVRW